ncbi:DUF2621 domain-containing protein [Halobacillus litoralis]|uniref:DUF2621 domain-containing protein n=1 Tax=Halobacillus litoralis TaxID=45668 RepID=UPI001CD2BA9E|nr:DUF2621 domain-containing protein [Halobacillus litoralis]MCA0969034.1 DUF2621 domain-containing protein [Halobacillus litoralis]
MSGVFALFIVGWIVIMVTLMGIGGFFMFRKFLKRLPKEDGKSVIDWEEYYVDQTKHMWSNDQKALLEELISPVPELFRDVARQKIAGRIGELAIEKKKKKMTQDLIIEGYILATPKRDHKFLIKKLDEKEIDLAPYEPLLERDYKPSRARNVQ